MFTSYWRGLAATCLSIGLFAGSSPRGLAQALPAEAKDLPTWVQKRVQAWQPSADERKIDQIAWSKDLITAQKLAKDHDRPVFLFSYSGSAIRENAIALERC